MNIAASIELVALLLGLFAVGWGPVMLLFIWKDAQRWWFLNGYLIALAMNVYTSLVMTGRNRVTNPLGLILLSMVWRRAYRVWRARHAPVVLAAEPLRNSVVIDGGLPIE